MDAFEKKFLGREFMTWLVYYVDQHEGKFDGFSIHFGDRALLRSLVSQVGEMRVKGESPTSATDLLYAIAGGLTIREAELLITKGKRQFKLVLVAETFDLKAVKLPTELDEPKQEENASMVEVKILERLTLLQELDLCVTLAFKTFLEHRLSTDWDGDTVPKIRNWLIEALTE